MDFTQVKEGIVKYVMLRKLLNKIFCFTLVFLMLALVCAMSRVLKSFVAFHAFDEMSF